jgi:hypothetical protein
MDLISVMRIGRDIENSFLLSTMKPDQFYSADGKRLIRIFTAGNWRKRIICGSVNPSLKVHELGVGCEH